MMMGIIVSQGKATNGALCPIGVDVLTCGVSAAAVLEAPLGVTDPEGLHHCVITDPLPAKIRV